MSFDFSTINARFDAMQAKAAGNPRGKALEELVAELFDSLPGVVVEDRNVLSGSREAEFDIQLSNQQMEDGLPVFGRDVFVECKSSKDALSAHGVQHFAAEMLKRQVQCPLCQSNLRRCS